MRVCVSACMRVCIRVCLRAYVHACVLLLRISFPAANSRVYLTPDQTRLITKRGERIEAYHVASQNRELSVPADAGPVSCSSLSNKYFVFSIKQKTGELSHFLLSFPSKNLLHQVLEKSQLLL